MKAFIVKSYGKKEKLHLTDWAEPTVNENDVLVQIHSAGVNSLDSLIRNGEFKLFLPYKTTICKWSRCGRCYNQSRFKS